MFIVDRAVRIEGRSYETKLRAPFSALQGILGPPFDDDRPERCSTMWAVSDGPHQAFIHDWHDHNDTTFELNTFRALAQYDWRIAASSEQAATAVCRWLSSTMIAMLGEVRTLGQGGRAELNRLLAEGLTLTDALQRMPMQTTKDLEARFRWPIRS